MVRKKGNRDCCKTAYSREDVRKIGFAFHKHIFKEALK